MHFILALANTHCQMHYEIRSQKSSSSDPPTTGSTVTQGVTGSKTACRREGPQRRQGSRPAGPGHVREGRHCHFRQPATTASASVVPKHADRGSHPRKKPQRSGSRAAIRCAIPRTHRWAGAATPTQRNTTQALDRARRASDVINVSNLTSKNKPPWLLGDSRARRGCRSRGHRRERPGPTPADLRRRLPPRPGAAARRRWPSPARSCSAGWRPSPPPGRPAVRHERHRGLLAQLADHHDARRPRPPVS